MHKRAQEQVCAYVCAYVCLNVFKPTCVCVYVYVCACGITCVVMCEYDVCCKVRAHVHKEMVTTDQNLMHTINPKA